jgi:hypothetical protein
MRKSALVLVLLALLVQAGAAEAQAQDLDRNEGFFGPAVKITAINQRLGIMAGLRGSWPVGRSLALAGKIGVASTLSTSS